MLDMVFNHTSSRHQWFQKALAGMKPTKISIFSGRERLPECPHTNWESKFGGSAWEYVNSSMSIIFISSTCPSRT